MVLGAVKVGVGLAAFAVAVILIPVIGQAVPLFAISSGMLIGNGIYEMIREP